MSDEERITEGERILIDESEALARELASLDEKIYEIQALHE
jgi:hypothetical protein